MLVPGKQLLLVLNMLFWSYTGFAEIVWSGKGNELLIGDRVFYLEDKSGALSIESVSHPNAVSRFRASSRGTLNFGFTRSTYWLRITVNNTSNERLFLSLEQAFLSSATLYFKNEQGRWDSLESGYRIPLYQKKIVDHFQIFPLSVKKGTFYIRLVPYLHAIPVVLIEENAWSLKAAWQKLSYGIYSGILLFAITVNIFLFFSLRKTYFLNYALLVFFYLLTSALVMEGYVVYLFPNIDLMWWYKIVPVLDMPALLFYCIAFFELQEKHRRLHRMAFYSSLFCVLYLLVVPFLPLLPVLVLNQVLALLVFILGIYIGLHTGKKGNRLGFFFAGAYAIWFLLVSIEMLYIQLGFPLHIIPVSYVSIAIFTEAFLLAFLQARRFGWERKADHRRQFEMEQQFQRDLLNSKLEIQEQTFSNISQELHDNIGQVLSLAKVQASVIEKQGSLDKPLLFELKRNVGQALTDLRVLARGLNSSHVQNLSLSLLLLEQTEKLRKLGLEVDFITEGEEGSLNQEKKLIIFRIIQEALQNILKHAGASLVRISIAHEVAQLKIQVVDNGKGFDIGSPNHANGIGMNSMKNRAATVGADLVIESSPGRGTSLLLSIPHRE